MKACPLVELTISDLVGFLEYVRSIPELIKKHAGRYLVQGGKPIPGQQTVDSNILLVEESAAP